MKQVTLIDFNNDNATNTWKVSSNTAVHHSKTQRGLPQLEPFTQQKIYQLSSNEFETATKNFMNVTSTKNTAYFLQNTTPNSQEAYLDHTRKWLQHTNPEVDFQFLSSSLSQDNRNRCEII